MIFYLHFFKNKLVYLQKPIVRIAIAMVFIFSFFAKWNEPLAFQVFLSRIFQVQTSDAQLLFFVLIAIEFFIGFALLFRLIPKFALYVLTGLLIIFTGMNIWFLLFHEIQNCHCFGSAWKLSPLESLIKNVVLWMGTLFLLKHENWHMNRKMEIPLGIGILLVTFFLLRYFYPPVEYKIAATPIEKVEFQFIAQQKNILLIDARSPAEYMQEHIPGAINIPYINGKVTLRNLLENNHLQKIQKYQIIVTYCGKFPCGLGEMLAKLIKQIYPYKNVYTLKNGIYSWKSFQLSDDKNYQHP